MKNKIIITILVTVIVLFGAFLGLARYGMEEGKSEGNILVYVHVLKDQPGKYDIFELKEGEPKDVGVYESDLGEKGLPGARTFRKIDSILLVKVNKTAFYGEKSIRKIEGTMVIGYPSANFIDGMSCVEINQSKERVEITVHYWETNIAIL